MPLALAGLGDRDLKEGATRAWTKEVLEATQERASTWEEPSENLMASLPVLILVLDKNLQKDRKEDTETLIHTPLLWTLSNCKSTYYCYQLIHVYLITRKASGKDFITSWNEMHVLYDITPQPAMCHDDQKRKQNWFANLILSLPMLAFQWLLPSFVNASKPSGWKSVLKFGQGLYQYCHLEADFFFLLIGTLTLHLICNGPLHNRIALDYLHSLENHTLGVTSGIKTQL